MPIMNEQSQGARDSQEIVAGEINRLKDYREKHLYGKVGPERDEVDNQIDALRRVLRRMYKEVS